MENNKNILIREFEDVKEVSNTTLGFAILGFIIFPILAYLIFFRMSILDIIFKFTYGLVQRTLVVNLLVILVLVHGVMFCYGKLKASDVGFKKEKILQGVFVIFIFWIVIQVFNILVSIIQNGTITLNQAWTKQGPLVVLGALIAQLFGNALFEEISYRGFLIPQIYVRLKKKWLREENRYQAISAIIVSQFIFAFIHIPNRIYQGMSIPFMFFSLFLVFLLGVMFAFVYFRTNNLFIAIGVHSLANNPTLLVNSNFSAWITVLLAIVLIIFWPRFTRIRLHRSINKESSI